MANFEVIQTKRGRGRPPSLWLQPGIKQRLIDIIREGNYITTATAILGLSDDFVYRARVYAENGKAEYVELIRDLKKAEAEAERAMIAKMLLGKENFLPAATFLERRFRDRWGRSDRHQIDATVAIRIEQVDYSKLAKEIHSKR